MAKAPAKTGGNAVAIPDFMKGAVAAQTNIDSSDLELPRVKLIQALSAEVDDGESPGTYFHNVAEVSLGDEIRIVPVHLFKSFMLWRPQDDGGGLLARAMDAINWQPPQGEFKVKINKATKEVTWKLAPTVKESGLDQWGTEDPDNPQSPPAATKMINVVCWSPDFPDLGLFVFTFQKGSLKIGTRLVTKIGMSVVPSFGMIYKFGSKKIPNSKNQEYWVPDVSGDGLVQDADTFNMLKGHNETVSTINLSIHGADDLGRDEGEDDGPVDEKVASRV